MANNHYNEPAFPDEKNSGLTKREYFAAMAMQGRIAASSSASGFYLDANSDCELIAKESVAFADALLTELNKESNEND